MIAEKLHENEEMVSSWYIVSSLQILVDSLNEDKQVYYEEKIRAVG